VRGISGKVVIVTGGATHIGAMVAQAFVTAGAKAALLDIDAAAGAKAAAAIGPGALFVRADLASDSEIGAAVALTVATFGGIDFLVNLAASYVDDGYASTRAQWCESLDINLVAGAMMLQAVRPHLVARGGGAVVNFGSISAKVAQTGRWLYPVSKAAILQLTRNEAMDLAADGIRVNSISPGWTWSRVIESFSGGDRAKADRVGGAFHFPKRIGDAEEVAEAVVFLCSDHASFITGTDLAVDGGYSAMGPEMAEPAIPKLMEPSA
jgi:NAD(P)-dependent dehydrogenase (short-subunit alcohol dehydrogenase family)